jgi:hypothetical protein
MSSFKHKTTGEEVTIQEVGDNFYKLDNGKQILQTAFMESFIPTDVPKTPSKQILTTESINPPPNVGGEIDPESFFNNPGQYNDLVGQLNNNQNATNTQQNTQQNENVDMSTIVKSANDGIIMQEPSIEDRVAEARTRNEALINKYGNKSEVKVNGISAEEQQKIDDHKLLTGETLPPKKSIDPVVNKPQQPQQAQSSIQQTSPQNSFLDGFMAKFKKNYDVSINLEVNEKIVEPNFLKMVSDNVNDDIIEWYAGQFVDKILYDPDKLKEEIYNQLYFEVYGELPKIEEIEVIVEKEPENDEEFQVDESQVIHVEPIMIKESKSTPENRIEDGIEGKPTKSGKVTYKFINKKGEIKDYLPKTAKKNGYILAKKEDLD